MSFVKSVDASDMIKTADTLFKLFAEVIEWVGSSNIVHVVTDNVVNYVSAGKLIHEKYPNIFWSPCAAHCINLILKDIASLPHIADLASRASKLLRLVDVDEKPSLGIVYAGMQRAKINIKTMFRNRKSAYTPYTSKYLEVFVDLFDIETLCDDSVAAMQEIQLYRDRKESFGRESALKAIKRLEPGEWWRLHGGSAPNLQKMAIRLLHQTSSSSGCERNWSLFE
ncbi:uncharacterized protein LOC110278810 [Arachis duranensis]|uniref:Uncharacterized protein LOC110278810 n=1 Tax=Arachis duranensis TaxID=130453 RepID=A0A6P5N9H8_ARADU|nr:uncharacterized protein LOC110278810 [Arachis duranensis]